MRSTWVLFFFTGLDGGGGVARPVLSVGSAVMVRWGWRALEEVGGVIAL